VDLTLRVGQLQDAVVVTEDSPVVSVTTRDISGLVGERQMKDLPLNGRSYDQLLTLNPGIVNYTSQRSGGIGTSNSVVGSMFSTSGRRPQENLYLLNGVEYTSASEINNTPGGVSGQLLGVDAVREFAVVKDSYGAEYGKRPGAQVNIVTASAQTSSTVTSTIFFGTAPWTPGTSSTRAPSRSFNAVCSVLRSAGRCGKTRPSCSEITKASGRIWG